MDLPRAVRGLALGARALLDLAVEVRGARAGALREGRAVGLGVLRFCQLLPNSRRLLVLGCIESR